MEKKIFDWFLKMVSNVTHKQFVYTTKRKGGLFAAVKSKYGFWYCGDIADQADIAYGVASKGTVEAHDTEVVMKVLKNLKPDFIFYDVGSNTGWYTMISFAASEKSKVCSFEPLLEHVECQKETIYLNRKENSVKIFELALSDHNGKETIRLGGSGTSLDKDFLEVDFGTRTINVQTLDSLIKEDHIPYPDFIKIDVEGHEYKVLQGSRTVLQSKPILFIEIAKTLNNKRFIHKEFDTIFSTLASLHYKPYIVMDGTIRPFRPSEDVHGVHMFLFLNEDSHMKNKDLMRDLQIS